MELSLQSAERPRGARVHRIVPSTGEETEKGREREKERKRETHGSVQSTPQV
jgi:hypothetical protein